MKCIACGEENVQNAKFCAFCGAKLETALAAEPAQKSAPARGTAQPLNENPYQPHRTAVIPPHPAAAPKPEYPTAPRFEPRAEKKPEPQPEPESAHAPRQIIKPAPKRVFLFDEEQEEEERRREEERKRAEWERKQDLEDGFDDDPSEYEDYGDDEDDEPRGGRIFVRIFSVLTVLALVVGVVSFLYGTTLGCRLRASMGLSSSAEDYLILADWQLSRNSAAAAADSYHDAFKLAPDDYDLAIRVGQGFENAGDLTRAESLYSYLIGAYPQQDEPYDRLLALLNRQGRTDDYREMLTYREQHQKGYVTPETPAPQAPTANVAGGEYNGRVQVTLSAGANVIRYTLDGSAPTASSLLYSGPITLSKGTYTIRAVAVKEDQLSAEWSASYVVK